MRDQGKGINMPEVTPSLEEIYQTRTPQSREFFERGALFTSGPAKGAYFFHPYPLTMAKSESCYLEDVDGRRYLDFANHHTTQILGHNHPSVIEAVQNQLQQGIALGAPTGIETKLAEEMCRRVSTLDRIRFVNSGTEATLHSIRLARGFSKKSKIAKFEGGYHGSHDVVEVSVAPPLNQAGPSKTPFSVPNAGGISPNAINEVLVLPYNDEEAVEKLIKEHCHELSCVIFDPKAGLLPIRPEFASFVRDITRQNNLLLIFDEIVGFRVGTGGLQEKYGIDPDLTCFGKIIGGGFPVGAFGGRADLMDLLDNSKGPTGFFQSGSFSAHPITMAAGLATLQQLTPEAFDHLNKLGDYLSSNLNKMFSEENFPAQSVNLGSVFSIYFTDKKLRNYRDLTQTDKGLANKLFLGLLEEGYFLSYTLTMCCLSLPMEIFQIDGLIKAIQKTIKKI